MMAVLVVAGLMLAATSGKEVSESVFWSEPIVCPSQSQDVVATNAALELKLATNSPDTARISVRCPGDGERQRLDVPDCPKGFHARLEVALGQLSHEDSHLARHCVSPEELDALALQGGNAAFRTERSTDSENGVSIEVTLSEQRELKVALVFADGTRATESVIACDRGTLSGFFVGSLASGATFVDRTCVPTGN